VPVPVYAPFDYRLGRHPFKVERWVRFPYGVPRCTVSLYAVAGRPLDTSYEASQTATRVLLARLDIARFLRVKCLRLHGGLPNLNRWVRIPLPAPSIIRH